MSSAARSNSIPRGAHTLGGRHEWDKEGKQWNYVKAETINIVKQNGALHHASLKDLIERFNLTFADTLK